MRQTEWPFGVVPERTDDPAAARALLATEGAVILVGCGPEDHDSAALARVVLGDDLLALGEPFGVRSRVPTDRPADGVFVVAGPTDGGDALTLHVDGFAYGDQYPDVLFLTAVHGSGDGGASFLCDFDAIYLFLAADPVTAELAERLATRAVDLSQPGKFGSVTPFVRASSTGRRMVRWSPDARPTDATDDPWADAELIEAWHALTRRASAEIPRFTSRPGEMLCVDNYRVAHGREAFAGQDRLLWRLWAWTRDVAFGVPARIRESSPDAVKVPV